MRLMFAQFFGSLVGAILLINSQHAEPHLEGWMIIGGVVIMSTVSNYVGFRNGLNNK